MGLGMGMGYGLSSWLFGPMLYNWGYANYSNPYYGGGGYGGDRRTGRQQPVVYDYSQPINSTAPPPDETVTNQAMAIVRPGPRRLQTGAITRGPSTWPTRRCASCPTTRPCTNSAA